MAKKEEAPAPEATEAPAAPSRKKKILILAIIALLILGLAGGGGLFAMNYFKKKHKPAEGENEEEVAAEQEKKKKEEERKKNPPVFSKLDTFTVNLQHETGDQYLQIGITLKIENALADASMKAAMPEIRDSIIRLLASKKASELSTTEGKDALAEELKDTLNLLLKPDQPTPKKGKKKKEIEGPVLSVLFTDFIIQ